MSRIPLKSLPVLAMIIILGSCSHVNYYMGFTIPKDDVESLPKLMSGYFNDPSLNTVRIAEFNTAKYMGVLYTRANNSFKELSGEDRNVTLYSLQQMKSFTFDRSRVVYGSKGKTKYAQYTPVAGEGEITTFFYLLTMLNEIKKNKNVELYSQTSPDHTRTIIVLYKD